MNRPNNLERAVRFRLRPELQFAEYAAGAGSRFVVKDPIKLDYFLFDSFERSLLDQLRNPLSAEELKQQADRLLKPGKVSLEQITQFIRRLFRDNLLLVDRTGTGQLLWQSNRNVRNSDRLRKISSLLSIRFPGIDPRWWLDIVNPLTRWLFHPIAMALAAVLFVVSLLTVLLNFDRIAATPLFSGQSLNSTTMVAIALGLVIVKFLHELGHALACRSINRDCHEIGAMLLVFFPCLYCNVSDVWMEPNRWKRILVSAAGIHVEMLIAVLCVPLWLTSQNPSHESFWLAMLMICSLNTLLVNGNPLLRYDGYYVLSDLVDVPNLGSESRRSLQQRVASWFYRSSHTDSPVGFVEVYGLASLVYRWVILGVILTAIYSAFSTWQLPRLGAIFVSLIAVITLVLPAAIGMTVIGQSRFWSKLRPLRTSTTILAAIVVLWFLMQMPIAPRIVVDGSVEISGNRIVFAPEDGEIEWLVERGDFVEQGQPIANIVSSNLKLELASQLDSVEALELAIRNQQLLQQQGADNAPAIELQRQSLSNAKVILGQLEQRQRRMQIVAAESGSLRSLPQSWQPARSALEQTRSTLSNDHRGSFVSRGEPIAVIADSNEKRIVVEVPEHQVERIRVGQRAEILASQSSPELVVGNVRRIAIDRNSNSPRKTDAATAVPDSHVLVEIELDSGTDQNFYRSQLCCAIVTDRVPLFRYLWDTFRQNYQM